MELNRRNFIKRAGIFTACASPLFLSRGLFAAGKDGANGKLNIGVIGLGRQANVHLVNVANNPNCMLSAICDVDDERLDNRKKFVEGIYEKMGIKHSPKTYKDFRTLLADKDIDAVFIVTPDHWHAFMAVLALRAGKHVYCEKPLTFTIEEGRKLVEEAEKSGLVFQTGSQQRSDSGFRRAVQLARSGMLGDIKVVWCNIPRRFPLLYNWKEEPLPKGIDWEMWLGPAPYSHYTRHLLHPLMKKGDPYSYEWGEWRWHTDYGNGMQADWGAHHYDIAQWGLNMDGKGPKYVEVFERQNEKFPSDKKSIVYTYENGAKVTYGVPKIMKEVANMPNANVTFVGTEGVASGSRGGKFWASTPALRAAKIKVGEEAAYMSEGHTENFVNAILTGRPVIAPVEVGVASCEVCIMGNIAYTLGRNLEWDWKSRSFVKDDAANSFLRRKNRGEWENFWNA